MKKFIYTTLLFFGVSQVLLAQAALLGNVKDEQGQALIGATVKVGAQGVVTDFDGNFQLQLAEGNHSIECSYVGYDKQKQEVILKKNESKVIDFQLIISKNILNQLTVTSGRYEKPLGEVTVSMEVLKPDLIERNNTQTIDNVLQKVPGVSIIGGQPNIRGGSGFSYGAGSRVLILVDDIPALQADAGSPNWNDFQIETIEQVEVVKGAASALYGSSALNGVVNIRTAYAKDKPLTTFSTFYTSYHAPTDSAQIWYDNQPSQNDKYGAVIGKARRALGLSNEQPYETGFSATHRRKINKLDLVLGTSWRTLHSFNEATYDSLGRVTIGTRYRINNRLYIGFNSNINFGKSKYFFYWKDGGNGAFQATQSTILTSQKMRYTIDPFVSYTDNFGNRHKFLGRFYSVKNNASGGNQNKSDLYYGEYQFQRAWKNGLVTTAGLVGGATFVSAELYGDTTYRSFNIAPYLQVEKKWDKLTLSGGGRVEQNTVHAPTIIKVFKKEFDTIPNGIIRETKPVFRLGANYQVADFTFLRASAGQGYRFPTIAEKFITSNLSAAFIVPNGKLNSETGWSSEIGLKQGLKIGNWNGFVDVAAFWTEYQDMMEFVAGVKQGSFVFQSQNVGDTRIKGVEATIAGQGKIGAINIGLLGGYTYIDPRFKDFDDSLKSIEIKRGLSVDYNVLKYRSKHSAKFDIETSYKGFSLGYALIYNSDVEAIDKVFDLIIPGVQAFRAANNKGFTVMDIRASFTFLNYYKLSFLLKNFTNEAYAMRPALMEAPRNANVRLDVKF